MEFPTVAIGPDGADPADQASAVERGVAQPVVVVPASVDFRLGLARSPVTRRQVGQGGA